MQACMGLKQGDGGIVGKASSMQISEQEREEPYADIRRTTYLLSPDIYPDNYKALMYLKVGSILFYNNPN